MDLILPFSSESQGLSLLPKLFIGNLHGDVTEEGLQSIFQHPYPAAMATWKSRCNPYLPTGPRKKI
jgi:hypothetical protein